MNRYIKTGVSAVILCGLLTGCKYTPDYEIAPIDPGTLISENSSPKNRDSSTTEISSESSEILTDIIEEISVETSDTPASNIPAESNTVEIDVNNVERELTDLEENIASRSLFIGDSICRGFEAYDVINPLNVFAKGNTATWNFRDFTMLRSGTQVGVFTYLMSLKPDYVFFWMGMNDINMGDEKEFCENYKEIIDSTLKKSSAEVYVCAITPVLADNSFTTNERIDLFNSALKEDIEKSYDERVHFVDFASILKDSENNMNPIFDGGDGIHLAPDAYYIALKIIAGEIGKNDISDLSGNTDITKE